jgi:hypothetical protein
VRACVRVCVRTFSLYTFIFSIVQFGSLSDTNSVDFYKSILLSYKSIVTTKLLLLYKMFNILLIVIKTILSNTPLSCKSGVKLISFFS